MTGALAAASALAVTTAGAANWNLPLLASLFAFAVISDLWAIDTRANPSEQHRMLMSGSFLALVLAMLLLVGAPAALIGVGTIVVCPIRFGERRDLFVTILLS